MANVLRGRVVSIIAMGFVAAGLIALLVLAAHFFLNTGATTPMTVGLEGVYSIDGGEWKPIDNTKPISETFRRAEFRGTLVDDALWMSDMEFSIKNVWFTLKRADGRIVGEHQPIELKRMYDEYLDVIVDESIDIEPISFEEYAQNYMNYLYFQVRMDQTPGYANTGVYLRSESEDRIALDEELTLEVVYPYDAPRAEFSDCFSCLISESNGAYTQFFYSLPLVLLFAMVCFFGLFFFPSAGFILGRIDYSYLAFGAMCFCWGLFMLVDSVSGFMNLWITDTTVCLAIVRLTNCFFIISILFYLKSTLVRTIPGAVANCLSIGFCVLVAVAAALHFTNVIDLQASSVYLFAYTAVCAIVMAVLLLFETLANQIPYSLLLSWIPLAVCVIIDAADHYLHFTSIEFYYIGLTVSMIYQLARSVMLLKQQYKEAIRYQQLQKELYEAKVSVMVSQIQPHFMYNALSSIAMLCKLEPETAYQATITFSQYLRSNMDSLKQTKPIPFTQELEHLKKYLYIEKLRFGKKLNIVYDIQATDFELPQLSIQPLAENAVKHGISKKRGGGTLTIATRETEDAYEIIVSDDGVGFDVNEVKNDGRSHIGMENIRRRLKEMCGAEVTVSSVIGEGTVALVSIPKGGNTE